VSLQDKIFDVEAFLEESGDKGRLEDFEDIITYLGKLERRVEEDGKLLNAIKAGLGALKGLEAVR
jgi:hypothetical protein